jgi:pilus assembly protein CpaC
MLTSSIRPIDGPGVRGRRGTGVFAILSCIFLAGGASAQGQPQPAPVPAKFPSLGTGLQQLPVEEPRPLREVESFYNRPSSNDAYFEVVANQSRILPLKGELKDRTSVAVGDPSILDFTVLSTRQIRVVGQRTGVTDISVITGEKVYSLEVRVIPDLEPLRLQLLAAFPEARLQLMALRDDVLVQGQARDTTQLARILETIKAYLESVATAELRKVAARQAVTGRPVQAPSGPPAAPVPGPVPGPGGVPVPPAAGVSPEQGGPAAIEAAVHKPQIINLIRIPGPQQVLLKVRVAELNRTALREIGSNFLFVDRKSGTIVGSQIGGSTVAAAATATPGLAGTAVNSLAEHTTLFGIFDKAGFDIMFNALRQNQILKILAEPNLMALSGHQANFLAGGKFPVPIAQGGSNGIAATPTVTFEPFGVGLDFLPFVLDNDTIRLTVHPSVSTLDFAIGTVLVVGGTPVPGLNTREAQTTVELHQGQTLAIAGLLQLELSGQTTRIPGLGDLPIFGPFFSNTTGNRVEKELVVLVTPYLVDAMNPCDVPPTPGDEFKEPNDLELYLLNRIEGRTGQDFRSTVKYDDALGVLRCLMKLEKEHVRGPHGYCDN